MTIQVLQWRVPLWSVKLDLQIRAAHSHQENPREVHRGPLTTWNVRITTVIFSEIQKSLNQPQTKARARPSDGAQLKCIMQHNFYSLGFSVRAEMNDWFFNLPNMRVNKYDSRNYMAQRCSDITPAIFFLHFFQSCNLDRDPTLRN